MGGRIPGSRVSGGGGAVDDEVAAEASTSSHCDVKSSKSLKSECMLEYKSSSSSASASVKKVVVGYTRVIGVANMII